MGNTLWRGKHQAPTRPYPQVPAPFDTPADQLDYLRIELARKLPLGTHVLIEWDQLLPIPERIPCERLAHQIPTVHWADTYSDVLEVPDEVGDELNRLWDAPHPGALHLPGWVVTRPLDGARTLADHLSRVLTAHR